MIQNTLSIIIALGILITFHEFGHYFVARRCGVKVLRFSVGFGRSIYTYVGKTGTEFTLAMIPLGGYVRMLDEREGSVPEALKSQAFNNKTVWQRIAIVAAGPIANFILAIVIYAIVAVMGISSLAPKVGDVGQNTPIAQTKIQAGDELIAIDGTRVTSWESVNLVLASLIGKTGDIKVRYQEAGSNAQREDVVHLKRWLAGDESSDLIRAFGLGPWRPQVPPVVERVVEGSAAAKAGLLPNDLIVSVDGQAVTEWQQLVSIIQSKPNQLLTVKIRRGATLQVVELVPNAKNIDGKLVGYAGVAVVPPILDPKLIRTQHYGVFESLEYGAVQTWKMSSLTVLSIGKMLQGLISIDNLSGPITIAKVASASADSGLQPFLKFMAYLSVSLGVLNLLPIPMLDGGHLLFFGVEAVRRKPVSERIQNMAYRLGASLLFAMMAIAIFNDLARF